VLLVVFLSSNWKAICNYRIYARCHRSAMGLEKGKSHMTAAKWWEYQAMRVNICRRRFRIRSGPPIAYHRASPLSEHVESEEKKNFVHSEVQAQNRQSSFRGWLAPWLAVQMMQLNKPSQRPWDEDDALETQGEAAQFRSIEVNTKLQRLLFT
jgi:hypothetical protein